MNCDVCGQPVLGKPLKVIIEGAKLAVCPRCAKLGKPYVEPAPRRIGQRLSGTYHPSRSTRPVPRQTLEELEVVEGFAAKIREAREKRGLTQEDLARRVKEKLSIIQKIESGKMTPDMKLCRELEHSLRIVLLTSRAEIPVSAGLAAAPGLTLGDVAKVKYRGKSQP